MGCGGDAGDGGVDLVMVVLTGARAVVSTLAGSGIYTYTDASGTNAGLRYPGALSIDLSGNVFVADIDNQRIRKMTAGSGMLLQDVAMFFLLHFVCDLACMFAAISFFPFYMTDCVYWKCEFGHACT